MFRIKQTLVKIVDYAYKDSNVLEIYKKFYVEVSNKNLKSKHGDYTGSLHRIRIYNLYRKDAAIIVATIHELAHHIDYINRGKTNHDDNFYAVYKKLLYAAIDLEIFSIAEYMEAKKDAADSNKVREMLRYYKKTEITPSSTADSSNNTKLIIVKNCYELRFLLKKNGYFYNGINRTWEKETVNIANEIRFLNELAVEYEIRDINTMEFNVNRCIVAREGSYDIKEELRKQGFKWRKNERVWELEVPENSIEYVLEELKNTYKNVCFFIK